VVIKNDLFVQNLVSNKIVELTETRVPTDLECNDKKHTRENGSTISSNDM